MKGVGGDSRSESSTSWNPLLMRAMEQNLDQSLELHQGDELCRCVSNHIVSHHPAPRPGPRPVPGLKPDSEAGPTPRPVPGPEHGTGPGPECGPAPRPAPRLEPNPEPVH